MAHFHLIERDDGAFGFELRTPDGSVLLAGIEPYTSRVQAIADVAQVRARSLEEAHFRLLDTDDGHAFELLDEDGKAFARSPYWPTLGERADHQRACRKHAIGAPLRMG